MRNQEKLQRFQHDCFYFKLYNIEKANTFKVKMMSVHDAQECILFLRV